MGTRKNGVLMRGGIYAQWTRVFPPCPGFPARARENTGLTPRVPPLHHWSSVRGYLFPLHCHASHHSVHYSVTTASHGDTLPSLAMATQRQHSATLGIS